MRWPAWVLSNILEHMMQDRFFVLSDVGAES
jgi:hypothetical protein